MVEGILGMRTFLCLFFLVLLSAPAFGYVRATFLVNNTIRPVFWQQADIPVRWAMQQNGSADLAFSDVFRIMNHSFGRWENGTYTNISFSYRGNSSAQLGNDGVNLIAFDRDGSLLGQGASTIATTQFFISTSTGRLLDADIIFNDRDFTFTTASSSLRSDLSVNAQDLEAVAAHEIGHLLGLDHAIIGTEVDTASRPTMTPFAIGIHGQTLEHDDVAGAAAIYPKASFFLQTANISGNVRTPAQEIFGAYVVALNATTNKPTIAVLTGYKTGKGKSGQGDYLMLGLDSGTYTIKAMPMDGFNGISPQNFNGIFTDDFVTAFKTQYYSSVFNQSQTKNVTLVGNSHLIASFAGVMGNVNLSVRTANQTIGNDTEANYTIIIGNSGNDKDVITLNINQPQGVSVLLNQTSFNLAEGESASVRLTISSGKAGIYPVTMSAISTTNASAVARATITTTIIADISVVLLSPQNNTFSSVQSLSFLCNATGLSLLTMTFFSGNPFVPTQTSALSGETDQANFSLKNIPDGLFLWNCYANDTLLRSSFAAENFSVIIDTTAPILSLTLNATVLERNQDAISMSWNAEDMSLADALLNISFPDGRLVIAQKTAGSLSLPPPLLSQLGTYTIDLVARDAAENQNQTRTFFRVVDTTSPLVTLTSPVHKTATATSSVSFVCNATDPTGLANITLYHTGMETFTPRITTATSGTENRTTFTQTLIEGNHSWNCRAMDISGNSSFAPENFTLLFDTSPPVIHRVELNDSYVNAFSSLFVVANISDKWTSLADVTANGAALQNKNNLFQGTAPIISTAGQHIMRLIARDALGNSQTTLLPYDVDVVAPSLQIYLPLLQGSVSQEDGTVPFLWQVTDENLSAGRVIVDNKLYPAAVDKTSLVQNFTAGISGLLPGRHTALFVMEDNASNTASVPFTFFLGGRHNISIPTQNIKENNAQLQNIIYRDGKGNVVTGLILLNQTLIKDFVIDPTISTIPISVNITAHGEFFNENNAGLVRIETNRSSVLAQTMGTALDGTPPVAFVFFQNMSLYLENYTEQNGIKTFVTINFQQPLGQLQPFYVADDEGVDVRLLRQCPANMPPIDVPSLTSMCYTNASAIVTLYVPHLSGGGLDDPANAPSMTIDLPAADNSFFNVTGTVLDLNIDASSCHYNMTNTTSIVTGNTAFIPSPVVAGSTNYTYSLGLEGLVNGSVYTLRISCASTDTNRTTVNRSFIINDVLPPQTKSRATTGSTSLFSTGALVVTYTTDELGVCGYNTTSPTAVLTLFSQTNRNLTTTHGKAHTFTQEYSTDQTITVPSVICIDGSGNSQTQGNESFSVAVDVTESSEGGFVAGGSGGGGGKTTPRVNSPAVIRKTATNIAAGQLVTMGMVNTEIAITHLRFVATQFIPLFNFSLTRLNERPNASVFPGKVYHYLDIVADPPAAQDITFDFRVANEWLDLHRVHSDDLSLYVFDGHWKKLSTQRLGASEVMTSYVASAPHFSLFAIGVETEAGKKEAEQEALEKKEEGEETGEKQEETTSQKELLEESEENREEEGGEEKQMWVWMVVVLLFGAIGVWVWHTHRE